MHRALAELMELGPDADETVYNTFLTERDGIVDAQREKALQKNRGKHGRAEPASAVGPFANMLSNTLSGTAAADTALQTPHVPLLSAPAKPMQQTPVPHCCPRHRYPTTSTSSSHHRAPPSPQRTPLPRRMSAVSPVHEPCCRAQPPPPLHIVAL